MNTNSIMGATDWKGLTQALACWTEIILMGWGGIYIDALGKLIVPIFYPLGRVWMRAHRAKPFAA